MGNQAEEPDYTSCMFGVIFGTYLHGYAKLPRLGLFWRSSPAQQGFVQTGLQDHRVHLEATK